MIRNEGMHDRKQTKTLRLQNEGYSERKETVSERRRTRDKSPLCCRGDFHTHFRMQLLLASVAKAPPVTGVCLQLLDHGLFSPPALCKARSHGSKLHRQRDGKSEENAVIRNIDFPTD